MDRCSSRPRLGTLAVPLLAVFLVSACAPRQGPAQPEITAEAPPSARDAAMRDTAMQVPAVQAREEIARSVPYEGSFGPTAPPMPASAMQKPLEPWVKAALDVWYQRPSPKGPPPIALASPKAIYVVGRNPVIQVLPGAPAFPDKIPSRLQTVMPEKVPYSNNVKRLRRGTIRLVALDRTLNDTKTSSDSMAIEASFTDAEGAEWRIEQVMLAPISPNPVAEPWFGGLAIDTLYHGETGNGTPAEPLVNCAMCSWGWADIYKNGKRVASSALLHIMVTSDTRGRNFAYQCYDCTKNPVREVHLIVPPMFHLPSPGGFLHVMWENAEVRRGTPERIQAIAPRLGEDIPTIELAAAPYLTWDRKEIRVKAGQKYRLVVHNQDPSSFHQFHLHSEPSGAGHHEQPGGVRHEEGAAAGGIGPLWKPGEPGGADEKMTDDPPGPRHVFLALPQGATWATMVMFEKPGEYEFMCPVANHYRRGMHGKFIVTASGEGSAQ